MKPLALFTVVKAAFAKLRSAITGRGGERIGEREASAGAKGDQEILLRVEFSARQINGGSVHEILSHYMCRGDDAWNQRSRSG
jgi:hypothetical protein